MPFKYTDAGVLVARSESYGRVGDSRRGESDRETANQAIRDEGHCRCVSIRFSLLIPREPYYRF